MTIDADLVTRKLLLISSDLDPLGAIHARGEASYLASAVDQAVVERRLERAIGRMIDVTFHVITASGYPPPPDYHRSFLTLAELGVLDPAFAREIARAAGLRNRLVHDYDDIDHRLVFDALGNALRDVPRYVAAVNGHLGRL